MATAKKSKIAAAVILVLALEDEEEQELKTRKRAIDAIIIFILDLAKRTAAASGKLRRVAATDLPQRSNSSSSLVFAKYSQACFSKAVR
ncbi:hypothetical protein ACLKA6_010428 [Drosophila palustris]